MLNQADEAGPEWEDGLVVRFGAPFGIDCRIAFGEDGDDLPGPEQLGHLLPGAVESGRDVLGSIDGRGMAAEGVGTEHDRPAKQLAAEFEEPPLARILDPVGRDDEPRWSRQARDQDCAVIKMVEMAGGDERWSARRQVLDTFEADIEANPRERPGSRADAGPGNSARRGPRGRDYLACDGRCPPSASWRSAKADIRGRSKSSAGKMPSRLAITTGGHRPAPKQRIIAQTRLVT